MMIGMTTATVLGADFSQGRQPGSRRRSASLAAWRRTRAVELAREGKTYAEIAAEVGYTHRGTAHRVVQRALAARQAKAVDELRALESARLDHVQASLWEAVEAGDIAAVNAARKIVWTRAHLLGLVE